MDQHDKTRTLEKSGEGRRPALRIGDRQDKKTDGEGKSKRGEGTGSQEESKNPDQTPDKPHKYVDYTEEEQKKLDRINEYIARAEKLRKDADNAAKQHDDEQRKRVLEAYKKLKEDYSKDGFGKLPDFSPDTAAKDLESEISKIEGNLNKVHDDLWQIIKQGKGKLTATGLIDTLQLLYGRRIDALEARIAPGGELIRVPQNPEKSVVTSPKSFFMETLTFKSAKVASHAENTIQGIGSSFATDDTISGGAIVGNGIAAASVSGRYAWAKEEESSRSDSGSMTKVTQIQDIYQFAPQKDIVFNTEDLELSEAAAKRLTDIEKKEGKSRRKAIVDFYETFGTHIAARSTVGGYYKHHAEATSSSTKERSKLEQTVTNASNWAVSASATYAALQAAAWSSGSTQGGGHCDAGNIKAMSYEANDLKVIIQTTVQGGLDSVPVDLWRTSLEFNSYWKVIDIDCEDLFPVWKLIGKTCKNDSLAEEFEAVWVQEIFAGSLPKKLLGDVAKEILSKKVATAKDLQEYIDNRLTAPRPEIRVWKASARAKHQGGLGTYWGTASVKVDAGYKLIGGGTSVSWDDGGAGNLLTASYPVCDGTTNRWSWEARCKDHVMECPATIEVWAIGVHDPKDELWDVQIRSERSDKDEHPTVTAQLDDGYALTGGGAMADWKDAGSLLTASYPEGNSGWTAQSKDLRNSEEVILTAYVIGIKPKNRAMAPPTRVFGKTSERTGGVTACSAEVEPGYILLGGGAQAVYKTRGHYLTRSSPNQGRTGWEAQSKDHLDAEPGQVTAYAIGMPAGEA